MNTLDIINLIQTFGVAVAGMVSMGWYVIKKDKDHKTERDQWRKDEKEIQNKHDERLDRLIDSVNENTISIKILAEKIASKGE